MSLEKLSPNKLDLATAVKSGDIDSKLKAIEILSDTKVAENTKATLVLGVVREILDEAIKGRDLKLKKDRSKTKRQVVNELKELVEIDEQSRTKIIGPGKKYKDEREVVVAPRVTMVYSYLSKSEDLVDRDRFEVMKKLVTADMGEKYLMMIDADWVSAEKAKSYINACIGDILTTYGSDDSFLKLDDLLAKFSTRGDLVFDDNDLEDKGKIDLAAIAFIESEETFCETVFESLSDNSKSKIRSMALSYPGAEAFMIAADQLDIVREDEGKGLYNWEELDDEE